MRKLKCHCKGGVWTGDCPVVDGKGHRAAHAVERRRPTSARSPEKRLPSDIRITLRHILLIQQNLNDILDAVSRNIREA
jgi:hypothetical protein